MRKIKAMDQHQTIKAFGRTGLGLLVGLGLWISQAEVAQACGTCQPPPPPKPPGCNGGCGPIVVPPSNVTVINSPTVVVGASARASVGAGAGAYGGGYYIGGGSSNWSQGPTGISSVPDFRVDTGSEFQNDRVIDIEKRWVTRRRVIQAVCLDDKQVPHPASQVQPGRDVPEAYVGEIYRCMAGTWLQATFADYEGGEPRFDGGRTLDCAKGEALVRDQGGNVLCRPQMAARDCNERSLLRRYGPGLKVVLIRYEETQTRTREVRKEVYKERFSGQAGTLVLDGGVGGMVH